MAPHTPAVSMIHPSEYMPSMNPAQLLVGKSHSKGCCNHSDDSLGVTFKAAELLSR